MKERCDLRQLPNSSASVNRLPLGYDWLRANGSTVHSLRAQKNRPVAPISRIHSLLVPLDGSPEAEHALPYALAIARRSGATVRLVHVHSIQKSVKFWQQYYTDELIDQHRRKKLAYLQSVVDRVSRSSDVQAVPVLLESGEIAESLCDAAADAALVVMATHGRGAVGRMLHGSIAESLMRRLSCPMLIVRGASSPVDLSWDPMPRHILIPLDGTNFAEQVFGTAAALGSLSCAKFTLAHIDDLDQVFGRTELVDPRGYLREAARRLEDHSPVVTAEMITGDQRVPGAILTRAEELEVDWIALTSHGRRGLARLVRRSVATSVVRKATMPVLVFRPAVPGC